VEAWMWSVTEDQLAFVDVRNDPMMTLSSAVSAATHLHLQLQSQQSTNQ